MTRGVLTGFVALLGSGAFAGAQVMSVTTSSVDLPSPDTTAYDLGTTIPASLTVMVSTCAGALGCREHENPPRLSGSVSVGGDFRWW
jgi:hypothetical protein